VTDDTAIREKAIPYAREERQWIREYCAKLCDLGILRQVLPGDEEPQFAVGAVLVKGGQSQQDHRMCANLTQVNPRIEQLASPLVDISNTLDELQGKPLKSALDVKAGFLNIRIAQRLKKFAGLVTQDALFVFQRMAFGYAPAPATF
jgi:hypothetical protein